MWTHHLEQGYAEQRWVLRLFRVPFNLSVACFSFASSYSVCLEFLPWLSPPPPKWIWAPFTSSSCLSWEEPVAQRGFLLRLTYTPRWKQLPCWGVPCRVRIPGCLVPEPEPVRAGRARLSAVACAQVPGLRGTGTTSTAVLVGKRPGLFNLRGFPGAGQGSLST